MARVRVTVGRPRPVSVAASADDDVVERIRAVAEEHAPDGGYGETFWHPADQIVFWVGADWTSNEEQEQAERAFLAIDGVDGVESEAEAAGPGGNGWLRVWPESSDEEAAEVAKVVALARVPLERDLGLEG